MIFAAVADWAASDEYPVDFMCKQLGVSVSGYYAWLKRPPSARQTDDEKYTALIESYYEEQNRTPGRRRVWAHLRSLGHNLSLKRVHKLMKRAGLVGRHPRPWRKTTIRGGQGRYAPDLIVQDFTAARPGTKLCGDITYIKTWDGWAYLATVIDLHNREVVGWALADHMRTELIVDAMSMAIKHGRIETDAIFHSDRGSVYASDEFATFCKNNNVRRSMGRTGTCYDNAVAESFFATYKKELVHTRPWPTIHHLRQATFEWIETYYNRTRRHSTLGYLTPAEYLLGYRSLTEIHRLAA